MAKIISRYINQLPENNYNKYIYRGQSDESWKITSTYYRRFNFGNKEEEDYQNPNIDQFKEYHNDLINNAKSYRYNIDNNLNDIELLQDLQHFGAATGLIDFSYDFLVALWFATTPNNKNGKIFLIDTNTTIFKQKEDIKFNDIKYSDIYFIDNKFKSNNRVKAQNGVFILSNKNIEADEEIIIKNKDKKQIRLELNIYFNINEEVLFQDVYGFAYINDINHPIQEKTPEKLNDESIKLTKQKNYKQALSKTTNSIDKILNNPKDNYAKLLQNNFNQMSILNSPILKQLEQMSNKNFKELISNPALKMIEEMNDKNKELKDWINSPALKIIKEINDKYKKLIPQIKDNE